MLPDLTLPPSLQALLTWFEPLFTAPSFGTFCAMVAGFLAQTGRRTVCGMLAGAGLSGCGAMTGRTGSSHIPSGSRMRWDWRWPGWWSGCWYQPGSR